MEANGWPSAHKAVEPVAKSPSLEGKLVIYFHLPSLNMSLRPIQTSQSMFRAFIKILETNVCGCFIYYNFCLFESKIY